jgi:hypothetical protein
LPFGELKSKSNEKQLPLKNDRSALKLVPNELLITIQEWLECIYQDYSWLCGFKDQMLDSEGFKNDHKWC